MARKQLTNSNQSTTFEAHQCQKNSDAFCYICIKFDVPVNRRSFSDDLISMYEDYFGIKVQNQTENWVPHNVCGACFQSLTRHKSNEGNKKTLKIRKPMIWRQPLREEDCYFCMTNLNGINRKNKGSVKYADVSSVTKPVEDNDTSKTFRKLSVSRETTHTVENDDEIDCNSDESILKNDKYDDYDEDGIEYDDDEYNDEDEEQYLPHSENRGAPELFTWAEFNDCARDLGLAKDGMEYLASIFKKKNLFAEKIKISSCRNREKGCRQYFKSEVNEKGKLVYCDNIDGLMEKMKPGIYKPEDWRLFIDASMRSLKAVLLHNTNVYAPIPVAHSTELKEDYSNLKLLLEKINYSTHEWKLCGDLKVLGILLGQQSGFTKTPCYLCLWDSRNRIKHYKKKKWPKRTSFDVGKLNIIEKPLVNPKDILIPPLHIKLGLMKQFVKALDIDGDCFLYLSNQFPQLSEAKLKAGVFNGPQIRKMLRDPEFIKKMTDTEKAAWLSFKMVVENFLGNHKSADYKKIVSDMVSNFGELGCLMNLKLHFLDSHIDEFPKNLGDFSEEQGERFHQDIKEIERRHQGHWDVNMMADYCWSLKRDQVSKGTKRKRHPFRRSFEKKESDIVE